MSLPRRPCSGPLEPFREGFRGFLVAEGYASKPIELHLALLSHVSRWLDEHELGPDGLTADAVEAFCAARRRHYSWFTTRRALVPLLGYLSSVGVEAVEPSVSPSPAEELVEAYRRHLEHGRGLAAGSIELYVGHTRRLVSSWWPSGDVAVGDLDEAHIVGFVRREASRLSLASTKTLVFVLRSLLRFLYAAGLCEEPLAEVVPSVADRRRASIPRHLSPVVVAQLIDSCDTTTVPGRRDVAILILLCRLGLRAGEVAGLGLADLDWRAGEVVIAGKGRRRERMPLPAEVGEAIVGYLVDGRPASSGRTVFVGLDAPHRPLTGSGVRSVVYHACDRAGLARAGPHRLRHTVATETLRAGGSLTEVAQLLRHRRVETTALYAKVDRKTLQALALPWPGASA